MKPQDERAHLSLPHWNYRLLAACVVASLVGQGAFCVFAQASTTALTSKFSWEFIGPLPALNDSGDFGGAHVGPVITAETGRVTSVAVDSRALFVGTAGGGAWLSKDGGNSFSWITSTLPSQAIGSIALDVRTNPSSIYLGTGEANRSADSYYGSGIYKSTDYGATWITLLAAGAKVAGGSLGRPSVSKLVVDASHNPPFVYAADTETGYSASRADAVYPEGDYPAGGLYRSTDGGSTWTQKLFTQADDLAVDPIDPSHVYAGIDMVGLWTSTDSGSTWNQAVCNGSGIATQLPCSPFLGRMSLGTAPDGSSAATKGTVYAMFGDEDLPAYRGLYRSSDFGSTWTKMTVPTNSFTVGGSKVVIDGDATIEALCTPPTCQYTSVSDYNSDLAVSPNDADKVFFGAIGPYLSTDGGKTWAFLPSIATAGGTQSDQHAAQFNPATPTQLLIGNDGGFYRYDTVAHAFTALNGSINGGQIQGISNHPFTPNTILAGFQDIGTELDKATLQWSVVDSNGDGGFTLFDPKDANYAYHSTLGASIGAAVAVSTNGGATWSVISSLATLLNGEATAPFPPLAVDPAVAHRVLFGAHHIYVSLDGMATWHLQSNQDLTGCAGTACPLDDIEFAPSDQTQAYTVAMRNQTDCCTPFKVFHTYQANLNSGATWSDVTGNLPQTKGQITGIAVDPFNPAIAYVSLSGFTNGPYSATNAGHIYKTVNTGVSWTEIDTGLPDVPVLKILVDNSDPTGNGLLAGTDFGLFRSINGGASWSQFGQGVVPAVPVFDIAQNEQHEIVVGTHGRGAFRLAPPVLFRGATGSGENCETGSANCTVPVTYPSSTKLGDTVVAMIFTGGGCHIDSDIMPLKPSWQFVTGTHGDVSYYNACGTDGDATWIVQRQVTPADPVPTAEYDNFPIAFSSTGEGWSITFAYSGANNASVAAHDTAYQGTHGNTFTSRSVSFSGHDGVALQFSLDLPDTFSPLGVSPEGYEDDCAGFITWSPPSGIVNRFQSYSTFDLATDLQLGAAGTYGLWVETPSNFTPAGCQDGLPPAPIGHGYGWTVLIPPQG